MRFAAASFGVLPALLAGPARDGEDAFLGVTVDSPEDARSVASGIVRWRFADKDYRKRTPNEAIREALRGLAG
jgi:hypothetical protein